MGAARETDVVIVGSGAAGGMAAYALTRAGARVVLLEAGRDYDPTIETPMFNLPSEAPLHGAGTPDKPQGYYDATIGGWNVPGEPYAVAEGSAFQWWRARMLGGRTNHWGRLAPRFGPYDFKGRERDGLGVDWPIGYDDLAPWYDRVERLIGVFGAAEGIENSPDSPPGILQPPPPMRAFEYWMKQVMERGHGIPVVPAHSAILTQPLGDRAACLYATDCQRGCQVKANFQSTTVLLPPARATGRLDQRTHAMAYEVLVDARGRAAGVRYIDTRNGARHEVRGRAVMLGAGTGESARLLLNSRPPGHADGLGNGSGQIGRNLMDTPAMTVAARVHQLEDLSPFHDEGVSLYHVNTPWWRYQDQRKGRLGFTRGYQIEFWGGRRLPEFDDMAGLAALAPPGTHGPALVAWMRRGFGSIVYLSGRGEMLPNPGSYCELDPRLRDRFGLPVLRFHWRWGANEIAQMADARRTLGDVFASMNATILSDMNSPIEAMMRPGGQVVHEVGTARMGSDPTQSVLDGFCQAHQVPGLYVVDGAAFASSPHKNPTLTILALAWRAADHLSGALRRGDL